jgi:hypothetical protein
MAEFKFDQAAIDKLAKEVVNKQRPVIQRSSTSLR